jgi:Secretion system C-terminal sorting domain
LKYNLEMKKHLLPKLRLVLILLCTCFFTVVEAQTTWTGTNDISWTDPGNWSAGVPDAADDVTIPNTTNKPTIAGGTAAVGKSIEVQSGTTLTIAATASLTLNGSKSVSGGGSTAFLNDGTVQNNGQLIMGDISAIGGEGLYNRGTFNNNTGSDIKIDRSIARAILNRDATFNNSGLITIGAVASVGQRGINNFTSGGGNTAVFNNTAGEIKIDNTTGTGLYNEGSSTFTNAAKITIGATTSITGEGIDNRGTFNNNTGGDIKIDRTGRGLLNHTATFNNAALITIGASASVGQRGLNNFGATAVFNNNTGGEIKIDSATRIGLFNESGTFNNVAKITIGATTSTGVDGLNNSSTFNNNTGGQISVNRATGLNSSGLNNASGTFINVATITITNAGTINTLAARDGAVGIRNQATFNNNTGGQINTNDLTGNNSTGIRNQSGTFNNEAIINIGDLVIGGAFGIFNLATFNNNTGGQVNIDRSSANGLANSAGTFTNAATITIGAKASVGANGIFNQATFNNNPGGQINLDRSFSGIRQFLGTFNNAGKITTGTALVNNGIRNESTFNNNSCGEISTLHPLLNSSNFTNAGLFRENTTSAHTNSGTMTNNGIIEYPQGNPIPNVTNNDVILAPITVCSTTSFSPALQIGGANSFTVGTTWYKEPALTNAAGTYSPNTFTVTNLTAGSTYPLYFEITDPVNMCTRTVGINVTVNTIPPTPTITGPTTFCAGSSITLGSGSATGNQWYLDGNPIGGATNQTYTATAAGIYTVVVTASGCPSAPSAATTVNQTTATLAINQDMTTTNIVPGGNLIFGNDCRAIGVITPNGANPVSGNVDSKVWVQATQPSFNGRPYLRRHYEITPANNPNTATARVTLYATQAEFDDFNQFAYNGDDMPTGPADNAGIANIRFYKYSGTSSDGSGSPGTYTQPGVLIDPDNSDIIWNSTLSRWEISFDVTGFSGFFGGNGGNTILPLQLLSFNGSKQANRTLLNWKTANEQNTKSFELESSTDGRNFIKITTLNAAGNGSHTYSYTDASIYKDKVWYRLKMLDADGKFTYSSVVLMNQSTNQPITIYPNPAISVLNINLSSAKLLNTNAQLTDAKGSLLQVVRLSGYNQPVTIGQLAKGIYLIKFADGTVLRFVKE